MGEQGQKETEGALPEPDKIVCVGNRQKRSLQTPRCLSPEWANNRIGRRHVEFIEPHGIESISKKGPVLAFLTSMTFADFANDERFS